MIKKNKTKKNTLITLFIAIPFLATVIYFNNSVTNKEKVIHAETNSGTVFANSADEKESDTVNGSTSTVESNKTKEEIEEVSDSVKEQKATDAEEVKESDAEKTEPQTLKIKGTTIKWFTEIGQKGINADHNVATTWGGDFNPDRSTLIAGHDDGPMIQVTKLENGDIVSIFDKNGSEFQYKFLKKKIISMVHDGEGSGFVENLEDDQYLETVLDSGNYLNLQVCVEYNASGYKIMMVTLEPVK